jgi:hypothetical protein
MAVALGLFWLEVGPRQRRSGLLVRRLVSGLSKSTTHLEMVCSGGELQKSSLISSLTFIEYFTEDQWLPRLREIRLMLVLD